MLNMVSEYTNFSELNWLRYIVQAKQIFFFFWKLAFKIKSKKENVYKAIKVLSEQYPIVKLIV